MDDEIMMPNDLRKLQAFKKKSGRKHVHFDQMPVSSTCMQSGYEKLLQLD